MIIDEVLRQVESPKLFYESVVQKATILKIQNVSDYYYENEKGIYDDSDFPNVAPPWPIIWMEWVMPDSWRDSGISIDKINEMEQRGLRFTRDPDGCWRVHTDNLKSFNRCAALLYSLRAPADFPEIKWIICGSLFFVNPFRGSPFMGLAWFLVKADGTLMVPIIGSDFCTRLLKLPIFQNLDLTNQPIGKKLRMVAVPPQHEFLLSRIYDLFDVPFLALCFCHCKNIALEEGTSHATWSKSLKTNRQETKFYTLQIKPMTKILDSDGASSETGIKRALHICRGHFGDYTKGGGLFGKQHGIYWFPQHLRGDLNMGTITKSYEVSP